MSAIRGFARALEIGLVVAGLALLGACAMLGEAADALMPSGTALAAGDTPAPAAKPDAVVEKAPLAPVALAGGLGQASAPEPRPAPAAVEPAPSPSPKPVLAAAVAPAEPAADPAAAPAPAPVNCPAGTIGMLGQPDIVGSAPYICRTRNAVR